MKKQYQGSCHYGKVRFEAELDLSAGTGTGRDQLPLAARARSGQFVLS